MAILPVKTYSTAAELSTAFDIEQVPPRVEPSSILMCDPQYFDIIDCKNPFMAGNEHKCDRQRAREQWSALKKTFENLGYSVHVVPAAEGLEDMVFSANQGLPGRRDNGERYVVAANMKHESRRKEVPHYSAWFAERGYKVHSIGADSKQYLFEGQGDAIWHPGKQLLWGAYGHRSEKEAFTHICHAINAPVLLLKLTNERFYHLDTAFCPLDTDTVMLYPGAFDSTGLELIKRVFRKVIEISDKDAGNFAGNAVALGRNVVLQQGSLSTCEALKAAGFNPVEVDTSEFMKSGGSVFCLKMQVYD